MHSIPETRSLSNECMTMHLCNPCGSTIFFCFELDPNTSAKNTRTLRKLDRRGNADRLNRGTSNEKERATTTNHVQDLTVGIGVGELSYLTMTSCGLVSGGDRRRKTTPLCTLCYLTFDYDCGYGKHEYQCLQCTASG